MEISKSVLGVVLGSIFVFILPHTAFAGPSRSSVSLFAQLQAQYEKAVQPNWTSLVQKIDSGRCFTEQAPDLPLASYLFIRSKMVDAGPVASPVLTYFAQIDAIPDLPADYFDQSSVTSQDPQIKVSALPLVLNDQRTYSLTFPQSLASMHLRAYQNTILGLGENELGEVTVLCYFFKIH